MRVKPKEMFILLADCDGTSRSQDDPFGVAVTTEAEAKRFVEERSVGYSILNWMDSSRTYLGKYQREFNILKDKKYL